MEDLPIKPIPSENKPIDKRLEKLNYKNLPKLPATFMILGRCGSGKTSILYSLLTEGYTYGKNKKSIFNEALIYLGSLDSKHAFEQLPIDNKVILTEFDAEEFEKYLDDLKAHNLEKLEKKKPPLQSLICFDDFVGHNLMKRVGGKSSPLERLALTSRHEANSTICLLSQVYKNTGFSHPTMRNNTTTYIISQMTRPEIEKIAEEHSQDMTPDEFIAIYDEIMKKPFNFMVIDYRRPLDARITERFHIPIKKPIRFSRNAEAEVSSDSGSGEDSE